MFSSTAAYYDAIYAAAGKDYAREVELLHGLIQRHKRTVGMALLDAGCGTGGHVRALQAFYQVSGLDLDPAMLEVARQKHPGIPYYTADMADFDLGVSFDIVACLFSSIGYVKTLRRLHMAIQALSRHLVPGGLLMVVPWFAPSDFRSGHIHAVYVDQPELKIARVGTTLVEGTISILDFHYLIATPGQVRHLTERHELGLFTQAEYLAAFERAGLQAAYEPYGLDGRGLYVGLNS